MSTIKNLGNLLITIDEALFTLFGDNAHVTQIIPSRDFDNDGTLLDLTITILKNRYNNKEEYDFRRKMLDELIYNPLMHSDWILTKVNISFVER